MAQEIKKSETPRAMTPRYADPFAEMRNEMEKVFDSVLGRGWSGQRMPALFGSQAEARMVVPQMDIKESADELVVEAELPGLADKDVAVTMRDGVLTIKGEKKSEREEKDHDMHLSERSYGSFERSFRLPDTVDEERIAATFDKGVLRVTMPKRAEAVKTEKNIPIGEKA
mgnify:FL=1